MGLKNRIKGRINRLRSGLDAIRDEAKYPGRPADHRIAGNPFYESSADKQARAEASAAADERTARRSVEAEAEPGAEAASPPVSTTTDPSPPSSSPALPDPSVRPDDDTTDQDSFWFLDGSEVDEGWDETNPGKPKPNDAS